jgi:2-isopropylmalate synthase
VFDTTLRDGEQAPRNALSPERKLDLARRIESLGVDVIEAGFPAASENDFKATRMIAEALTTARVSTFCRANRDDVDAAVKAAGGDNLQVQVLATTSEIHLEHKRGITRKAALDELRDTVMYAYSLGVPEVTVALEDATRGSRELIRATVETSVEAGAAQVAIADTTGCCTPDEFGDWVRAVREWAPRPTTVGVHCHNDFGLATANTMAAIQAGADTVQVTVGGIGERAGNTAMEEVVALLAYKGDQFGARTDIRLEDMYEVYTVLRSAIGLAEPRNKALFGAFAFATAAGIHQHGILRNPATYEYVEATRFGREQRLFVGRHSGRAVLRHVLAEAGFDLDRATIDALYERYITGLADGDCLDLDMVRRQIVADLAGTP